MTQPYWTRLTVRSEPRVEDPRELQTILTFSLKSLWGDLEAHSCALQIEKRAEGKEILLIVRCLTESVGAVRAALTLVSPPPYLESNLYRFDVVDVEECA
jgi:RNase P/RNase MRP subunit POP5